MKKLFPISTFVILLLLGACSKKKELNPSHEPITFLNIVDSICNRYQIEDAYDPTAVKKGMHDYVGYYSANENPIFKDLPLTVSSILTAKTLDGNKLVTANLSYSKELPVDGKRYVYSIHVAVENEYEGNDSIPFTEGNTYYIEPQSGLVLYDGFLDVIGINESPTGVITDGRSFGTLKIKGASFKPTI